MWYQDLDDRNRSFASYVYFTLTLYNNQTTTLISFIRRSEIKQLCFPRIIVFYDHVDV